MTKRERAIWALFDGLWFDGQLVTDPEVIGRSQLGRIVDRIAAIMAEPDEPPDGKLRVRAAVAVSPGGVWSVAGADGLDDELATLKARPFNTNLPHSIRWIEADVTPWQPPAEETVQGREGGHD